MIMKHLKVYICLFVLWIGVPVGAIDFPTYTPSYDAYYGSGMQVSYSDGGFSSTPTMPMHSTSYYSTDIDDYGLGFSSDLMSSPFSSSPSRSGVMRAPGMTIGAAYERFLLSLPSECKDDIYYYKKSDAQVYWGSTNMPTGATWAGFLAWFEVYKQTNPVEWAKDPTPDSPIGSGLIFLLLAALAYAAYISYRKQLIDISKL